MDVEKTYIAVYPISLLQEVHGEAMPVVDPVGQFSGSYALHIPWAAIDETEGFHRFLRNQHPHPSLCMLFQNGRCRAGLQCNQVHADPVIVNLVRESGRTLRQATCCKYHDGGCDESFLPSTVVMVTHSGAYITIPMERTEPTAYLDNLFVQAVNASAPKAFFQMSYVCRLHQKRRCGYAKQCGHVHICREYWQSLYEAYPWLHEEPDPSNRNPKHLPPVMPAVPLPAQLTPAQAMAVAEALLHLQAKQNGGPAGSPYSKERVRPTYTTDGATLLPSHLVLPDVPSGTGDGGDVCAPDGFGETLQSPTESNHSFSSMSPDSRLKKANGNQHENPHHSPQQHVSFSPKIEHLSRDNPHTASAPQLRRPRLDLTYSPSSFQRTASAKATVWTSGATTKDIAFPSTQASMGSIADPNHLSDAVLLADQQGEAKSTTGVGDEEVAAANSWTAASFGTYNQKNRSENHERRPVPNGSKYVPLSPPAASSQVPDRTSSDLLDVITPSESTEPDASSKQATPPTAASAHLKAPASAITTDINQRINSLCGEMENLFLPNGLLD